MQKFKRYVSLLAIFCFGPVSEKRWRGLSEVTAVDFSVARIVDQGYHPAAVCLPFAVDPPFLRRRNALCWLAFARRDRMNGARKAMD